MTTNHIIPPKAKADVAFAGVELKEALPLLASLFAGLIAGSIYGWEGYVGVPLAGYAGNKLFLHWKSGHLPGHFAVLMYTFGIGSYSKAFDRQQKVFIGNGAVINPNFAALTDLLPEQAARRDTTAIE